MKPIVRIGCGAGFWGDSPDVPRRLVEAGGIDYPALDYLTEITMSILARIKAKTPDLGYATDFVTMVMKPLAHEIAERRIKVVTNAGGVNPEACKRALEAVFKEAGVDLKVAVVLGDDLSGKVGEFKWRDVREMFSGLAFPEWFASRQRLSRRLSDRRRARWRRRYRRHRAMRRFGDSPGAADS